METVIVQAICDSARCFSCGGLVYAVEKQRTTKHIYHDRCFRCRICKRNLNGSSLNEDGDDIYCSNCYRKKLRGQCQTPEFRRAAEEKAQYVYKEHHPDITLMKITPQAKLTKNPSLLLRKIERRFLSVPEYSKEKKEEKISTSLPIPLLSTVSAPVSTSSTASVRPHAKIRSVFQLPIALSRFRLNRSSERINEKDSSPSLHFSPAPTPLLTPKTEPLPRSEKMLFNGFPTSSPRLIRHFLFNSEASPRRTSVSFDVDKPPKEQQRKRSAPDLGFRTGPRRSLASLSKQLATIRETH